MPSPASPKLFGLNPIATLKANSIGTSFLLDHAVKSEAKKFLFFSSGEVYGQVADVNEQIRESDYGYIDPLNLRSLTSS
ncbi:NAD-dependent epimerase/dehydratase family protein [bacterium]|nr:NAD-dependent epimerase/dehydratase family protein [bacterium]